MHKPNNQQIFHFDEYKIEKICASLENGMYEIMNSRS